MTETTIGATEQKAIHAVVYVVAHLIVVAFCLALAALAGRLPMREAVPIVLAAAALSMGYDGARALVRRHRSRRS